MMDPDKPQPNALTSSVAIDSVKLTLELYRSGRSGIPYAALQEFTRPILDHYQLDIQHTFDQDVTAGNFEDMTLLLDIFEIASAIWDYCSLSDQHKTGAFKELRNGLLGPSPSKEDVLQFPILLAAMEDAWEALSPSLRRASEIAASELSEESVFHGAIDTIPEFDSALYGPEMLELPEAFTLFAGPILENDRVYQNPDALDEAMARAQVYWDIAHLPDARREKEIDRASHALASAEQSEEDVRAEALRMLERFRKLFPERQ